MKNLTRFMLAALACLGFVGPALAVGPIYHTTGETYVAGQAGYGWMGVRNDALTAFSGDGKWQPFMFNSSGQLVVAASCSVGGGVEDAAETAGGTLSMAGTVRRDTKASSAGTTGDNATLNTDANGGLWLAADVIEDAAETAGAPLVGVGTVRRDTMASSAGTTGDNATLNTNSIGALYTIQTGATTFVSGVITVTTAGTSVQGGSNTVKECFFSQPATNTGQCCLASSTGDHRTDAMCFTKAAQTIGPLHISNTNIVWADCITSGDKVGFVCTN